MLFSVKKALGEEVGEDTGLISIYRCVIASGVADGSHALICS